MRYAKIKVTSKLCPKRFYRVMLVKEDLSLYNIGLYIAAALRTQFEHYFLFEDKEKTFVDATWIEDSPMSDNWVDYRKYYLKDLVLKKDNSFSMVYDTGNNWEFKIKIYSDVIEKEENPKEDLQEAIVIKAKGNRLWEDHITTFINFLEGKESNYLESELKDVPEEYIDPFVRPWNIPEDEEMSNFDSEINLDELNKEIATVEDYYDEEIQ